MEKFVLPERWVVKASNDEEDEIIVPYINQTFGTHISSGLSSSTTPWYYSNVCNKNSSSNSTFEAIGLKHDGASSESFPDTIELTYDEFVYHIINKRILEYEHDPSLEAIYLKLLQ